MSSETDTQESPTRETTQETRTQEARRSPRTNSGAGTWAAALLLLAGIWVVVAGFFWGDPVGAEDVVARNGEVVAIEAATINGASTLYWSNIVVGVIIVILAIIILAAAGGYVSSDQ